MKILMTGGTGLIGRAFISQFSQYQYTVLSRSAPNVKDLFPVTVKLIDSLSKLQNLDEFDAVINLAGEPILGKRWGDKQKTVINQSRWQITQQLVDLFRCSQSPPEVLLSGSAIGVYGNRGAEVLSETTAVQKNDFPTTLCLRWEQIARQAEPLTRVALLRTGIVLASQGGALAKMLLPFKWCLGGRLGSGQQYMSWIHYRDHIEAMHYVLTEQSLSGPINLVAPNAVTNYEFTQALAKALHRFAIVPVPKKVLQYLLGESSCLLLDSQRVAPQALINSGFTFRFANLAAALADVLETAPTKEES